MAANAIDNTRYTSPSKWLESAEALVGEGMQTGVKMTLCGLTQVGAGFVAGFGMETFQDRAHIAGIPLDVLAGSALVGVGATGLGGEASEYVLSAGLGALSAAAGRFGREAAIARAQKAAPRVVQQAAPGAHTQAAGAR